MISYLYIIYLILCIQWSHCVYLGVAPLSSSHVSGWSPGRERQGSDSAGLHAVHPTSVRSQVWKLFKDMDTIWPGDEAYKDGEWVSMSLKSNICLSTSSKTEGWAVCCQTQWLVEIGNQADGSAEYVGAETTLDD